jgi:hypothetical protein
MTRLTAPLDHRLRRRRVAIAGILAAVVAAGLGLTLVAGALAPADVSRIAVGVLGVIGIWLAGATLQDVTERPDDHADDAARAVMRAQWRAHLRAFADRTFRKASWRWHDSELDGWVGLEQIVRFSEGSAVDFHARLRPRLSTTISRRLRTAGIDPADRAQVVAVLGELGAGIVEADSFPPHDREAPGVPAVALRDLLRRVESLS